MKNYIVTNNKLGQTRVVVASSEQAAVDATGWFAFDCHVITMTLFNMEEEE